jgi:hypothetical protein
VSDFHADIRFISEGLQKKRGKVNALYEQRQRRLLSKQICRHDLKDQLYV